MPRAKAKTSTKAKKPAAKPRAAAAKNKPPTTKKPPANKGGRGRKELNLENLKAMVRIQCTAEECAAVLQMSTDTLDRRLKELEYKGFAEFYEKYSHEGLQSLRRAQWKSAVKKGSVPMQIWLGKQMLGQKDKHELGTNLGQPINVIIKK